MESVHPNYIIVPSLLTHQGGNDSDTHLLLNFEGADESTTIVDESRNGYSVTCSDNAQIDTAQKKFGGSSLLLDGASHLEVGIADTQAIFGVGTGPITIDTCVRFNTVDQDNGIVAQYEDSAEYWTVYYNYIAGADWLWFTLVSGGVDQIRWGEIYAGGFNANQWYHIALIRGWAGNANDWAFTVDGTIVGNAETNNLNWPATFNGAGYIGSSCTSIAWPLAEMDGWKDAFRVSHTTRWTANFKPPTGKYKRLSA